MWHKPCRTFHPWCPCIKTRCLLSSCECHKTSLIFGALRQQVITLANVDPDVSCLMASLNHNEFIINKLISFNELQQLVSTRFMNQEPPMCQPVYGYMIQTMMPCYWPSYPRIFQEQWNIMRGSFMEVSHGCTHHWLYITVHKLLNVTDL